MTSDPASNTPNNDAKAHSQARFSQFADRYVTSETHSAGDDLERLLEVSAPQAHEIALDIATGGGHTALRLAPFVRHMIASDYALTMLNAARAFVAPQAANVSYSGADAENLPFAAHSFDLITCRIAAHHFPDIYRFVVECARVLKTGGRLVIQDHLVPHDARDKAYVEAFERLRDPSHVRALDEYEWRGVYLDAGLTVEHAEPLRRPVKLLPWAQRQDNPPEVIERLQVLLAQAPEPVATFIGARDAGTPAAGFDHVYMLISGRKP